jgi:hypothetical protein
VVDGSAVLRREDFGALQLEGEIAGGRSGDQADLTTSEIASAAASVSMCAASESIRRKEVREMLGERAVRCPVALLAVWGA